MRILIVGHGRAPTRTIWGREYVWKPWDRFYRVWHLTDAYASTAYYAALHRWNIDLVIRTDVLLTYDDFYAIVKGRGSAFICEYTGGTQGTQGTQGIERGAAATLPFGPLESFGAATATTATQALQSLASTPTLPFGTAFEVAAATGKRPVRNLGSATCS